MQKIGGFSGLSSDTIVEFKIKDLIELLDTFVNVGKQRSLLS
jgi:hypothetical protein